MKRFFAVLLCLCLLLGSVTVFAESGAASAPRANVTDTDPPEIISIVLKENKKTLKPGAVLHMQLKLDDRSDIDYVQVQFYNKTKSAFISFNLNYDAELDAFVGEKTLTKGNVNGSYIMNYCNAQDKYGNYVYSFADKGFCSFKISGASKGSLKGTVKLTENGKTVKAGEEPIHIKATLSTALPEAYYARAVFMIDGEENRTWGYVLNKVSDKIFEGSYVFENSKRNGKWVLKEVQIVDNKYQTIGTITKSQSFTLKGGSNDKTPPKIGTVTLREKGKTLTAGDTIHVTAKITDKSDISYVSASFQDANSIWFRDEAAKTNIGKQKSGPYVYLEYNASSKKWEGTLELPKDIPDGKYYLYIYTDDVADNYSNKEFPKLYINYKSPDFVDAGMEEFIEACWEAIWDKTPTAAEINQYGMPLATGKQKAVDVIFTLVKKAGLSGETAAKALWQIMQGKSNPSAAELSATVSALKTGLDYAIDSLNNAAFRKNCKNWGIKAGNLGTNAADTKVTSVDVDGGHYVLKGSKATLTGVSDKKIKKLVIQDSVKANGKTYKVTAVDGLACMGLAKLTTLTIGKNVTSIGPNAFANCKKLKTITVKSTKLKTVGSGCFNGIKSTATFTCPKGKAASYEKLFRNNGNAPKKAKFK